MLKLSWPPRPNKTNPCPILRVFFHRRDASSLVSSCPATNWTLYCLLQQVKYSRYMSSPAPYMANSSSQLAVSIWWCCAGHRWVKAKCCNKICYHHRRGEAAGRVKVDVLEVPLLTVYSVAAVDRHHDDRHKALYNYSRVLLSITE